MGKARHFFHGTMEYVGFGICNIRWIEMDANFPYSLHNNLYHSKLFNNISTKELRWCWMLIFGLQIVKDLAQLMQTKEWIQWNLQHNLRKNWGDVYDMYNVQTEYRKVQTQRKLLEFENL